MVEGNILKSKIIFEWSRKRILYPFEESIQSQIEVVNQKKYEILNKRFSTENIQKIIDQEKSSKAQSVEFFDNAERILQQDETLKQLTLKLRCRKLIDDVIDEFPMKKRWKRIADEIEIATLGKSDIKLVEDKRNGF